MQSLVAINLLVIAEFGSRTLCSRRRAASQGVSARDGPQGWIPPNQTQLLQPPSASVCHSLERGEQAPGVGNFRRDIKKVALEDTSNSAWSSSASLAMETRPLQGAVGSRHIEPRDSSGAWIPVDKAYA